MIRRAIELKQRGKMTKSNEVLKRTEEERKVSLTHGPPGNKKWRRWGRGEDRSLSGGINECYQKQLPPGKRNSQNRPPESVRSPMREPMSRNGDRTGRRRSDMWKTNMQKKRKGLEKS